MTDKQPRAKPRRTVCFDADVDEALNMRMTMLAKTRSYLLNYILRPALGLLPRSDDKDDYQDDD